MNILSRFSVGIGWGVVMLGLLLGIWIRVTNLTSTGYNFDTIVTQYAWARELYTNGFVNSWLTYNKYFDYTVVNYLYLGVVYWLSGLFGVASETSFVGALKSIYLVSDLVLLGLIFYLQKKFYIPLIARQLTLVGVFLYPGFWFVSGVWGQSDVLHMLMVLASLCLLFLGSPKTYVWSGLLFGLAFWFKPQALLVLIMLLLWWVIPNYKALLNWSKRYWVVVIVSAIVGIFGLSHIQWMLTNNIGVTEGTTTFAASYTPLLTVSVIAVSQFLVLLTLISWHNARKSLQFVKQTSFLTGFFGFTTIVTLLPGLLNPLQWYKTAISPLLGDPTIFRGSANLKDGAIRIVQLLDIYNYGWVFRLVLGVIFVGVMIYFVSQFKRLKPKDNLEQFLLWCGMFMLVFCVFTIGRMQTRYPGLALLLLCVILPKIKTTVTGWISIGIVFMIFVLNNVSSYLYGNNTVPGYTVWIGSEGVIGYFWIVAGMTVSVSYLLFALVSGKLAIDKPITGSQTKLL